MLERDGQFSIANCSNTRWSIPTTYYPDYPNDIPVQSYLDWLYPYPHKLAWKQLSWLCHSHIPVLSPWFTTQVLRSQCHTHQSLLQGGLAAVPGGFPRFSADLQGCLISGGFVRISGYFWGVVGISGDCRDFYWVSGDLWRFVVICRDSWPFLGIDRAL